MTSPKLPEVIVIADLAKAAGWPTQKMRRYLKQMGIVKKRGRRFVITKSQLYSAFPEAAEAYEKMLEKK